MNLLQEAKVSELAYAKIGIFGWQGSGKSFTAMLIALGLAKLINSKKPIAFFDSERGSDWLIKKFKSEGYKMFRHKGRALKDLLAVTEEAEKISDIMITDTVSAPWNEFMAAYKAKTHKKYLGPQDWGILKPQWQVYSDLFVNSHLHIIICGRAGWEWGQEENEEGRKELIKTGEKMKTEGEFGYEPSLLIKMEIVRDPKDWNKFVHRAHVLKDRSDTLDGQSFDNPGFKEFLPHIKELNLGGDDSGLDLERSSEDLFDGGGKTEYRRDREAAQVAFEELDSELVKANLSGSKDETKKNRITMLEYLFNTSSKSAIEALHLDTLKQGLESLRTAAVTPTYMKNILEKKVTYETVQGMKQDAEKEEDIPIEPGKQEEMGIVSSGI